MLVTMFGGLRSEQQLSLAPAEASNPALDGS